MACSRPRNPGETVTRVITDAKLWSEVRRRVLNGELSKRAACRQYGGTGRRWIRCSHTVSRRGTRRQRSGHRNSSRSSHHRRDPKQRPQVPWQEHGKNCTERDQSSSFSLLFREIANCSMIPSFFSPRLMSALSFQHRPTAAINRSRRPQVQTKILRQQIQAWVGIESVQQVAQLLLWRTEH